MFLVLTYLPWINAQNFSASVFTDCTNLKIVIFYIIKMTLAGCGGEWRERQRQREAERDRGEHTRRQRERERERHRETETEIEFFPAVIFFEGGV